MWFIELAVVSHFSDEIFSTQDWLIIAYPVVSIFVAIALTFVIFRVILWVEIIRLWFIENVDNSNER